MKESSHWSNAPKPILQATQKACNSKYSSKNLYLKYIREIMPFASVSEFGCGTAGWLATSKRCGAQEVRGYDLAEIDISDREISAEEFIEVDLSKLIDTGKKSDLVISTEVAEHIDEGCSDVFIENLCRAGDVILFSAAIPYQGGMGHINENWVEYWHEKFVKNHFHCFDIFRPKFWNDPRVIWYYRQNCLLYVTAEKVGMLEDAGYSESNPISMIHPDMYLKSIHRKNLKLDSNLYEDVEHFYDFAYNKQALE